MLKNKKILNEVINYILYTVGCAIYAAGVVMFINPAKLSAGGVTGLAVIINHFTDFPIGITVFVLNIPLLIAAFVVFGKKFVLRTGIVTAILSVCIDLAEALLKPYYTEPIITCLYGGILMGFGLGIVMLRGATTGGFDILAKLINRKFAWFSIGKCVLLLDLVILLINAVVYNSVDSALYTLISLFISSKVIDVVIYGAQTGKIVYIISPCGEEIAKHIITEAIRGVTVIDAKGAYTDLKQPMLVCAVRRHEVSKIISLARQKDRNAFIIVGEAAQINGNGFELPD